MKRLHILALSAVLSALTFGSAMAQEAFPDTPENHWAYEALANMKKAGLLVGYPDGLYRGARPASRYEMAVALHALYQYLNKLADGYDARIKALEGNTGGGGVTPEQLKQLRDMLDSMKSDLNAMKGWGDDIANLKKMASTFEKELASMGVDIEALKKGVNDLADRVSALEKRKPTVDVHGNIGLHLTGGYDDDGEAGITVDGRPVGINKVTGDPSGIENTLNVFHEGTLVLSGTNDSGPKWKAALSMHNFFDFSGFSDGFPSGGIGNMSSVLPGFVLTDETSTDIYWQEFNVSDATSFLGQGFHYKVGRVGHQAGAYTFKRIDNTPYYSSPYFDDGNFYFDGGLLNFNWGSAGLNVYGGRTSNRNTVNGVDLNPISAGQSVHVFEPGGDTGNNPDRPRGIANGELTIDQILGATLNIGLSDKGKLNLNYLIGDSYTTVGLNNGGSADRVVVFGGDASFKAGMFNLYGGYSQSNLLLGDSNVVDEDNAAWWVGAGFGGEKWGLDFGYRQIDPLFAAPGSWGRIGIWWNPSDIEGFWAKGHLNLTDALKLHGSAEFYNGSDTDIAGSIGLLEDDEITSFKINLSYEAGNNVTFWAGAEMVHWDLVARAAPRGTGGGFLGGETDERWYDVGVKYRMNDNSWWSIRWQISDYDGKGTSGMNPFPSFFSSSTTAKGGYITSTLGIKF